MSAPVTASCSSWPVSIFMAGDCDHARRLCREFCDEVGLCVTVTPTSYIYTDGEEAGFVVGLINYPRFSASREVIEATALRLAQHMREPLGQQSFTIQTPDASTFYSWRVA